MSHYNNESDEAKWINYRRQRRNFFLITVFMFSLAFTNSSIEHLSLLGNKITVGDSSKLPYLLWISFFYFALRYYYTHKEINDHSMQLCFSKILMKYFGNKAFNNDFKNYDLQSEAKTRLDIKTRDKKNINDYNIYTHKFAPETEKRNGDLWVIKLNWAVLAEDKKTGDTLELTKNTSKITINYSNIRWIKIFSWLKLMTSKYYFTEYHLPYVFGFITLILSIYLDKFIF